MTTPSSAPPASSTLTLANGAIQHTLTAPGPHVLGRAPTSAIVVDDATASKTHAAVRHDARQGWVIEDQGSHNGTFVNAVAVSVSPLRPGDTVDIGGTRFVVDVPAPTGSTRPLAAVAPDTQAPSPTPPPSAFGAPAPPNLPPPAGPPAQPGSWQAPAGPPAPNWAPPAGPPAPPQAFPPPAGPPQQVQPWAPPAGRAEAPASPPSGPPLRGSQLLPRLEEGQVVTLGRDPANSHVLADNTVSRFHARLEKKNGKVRLTDLGSHNGSFIDGARVTTRELTGYCVIQFGSTTLTYEPGGTGLSRIHSSAGIRAERVGQIARNGRTILPEITASLHAGEMVALIGPAGSGKSTLLNIMAGVVAPAFGAVRFSQGSAVHTSDLAHVAQDDLIHHLLTPREALRYAAALRLPPDLDRREMERAVDGLLAQLGLDDCADNLVTNVSGGQRKRSSVALELIGNPQFVFLDEPAAGLDAETDRGLMTLLRQLGDAGRGVMLTTHNTWHLDMCDRIVILRTGGTLAFVGRPREALEHFGASGYGEIYRHLGAPPTPPPNGQAGHRAPSAEAGFRPEPHLRGRHLSALASRTAKLLVRDRRGALMTLIAAPLVALLASLLFTGRALKAEPVTSGDSAQFLLCLTLIVTWLGAFCGLRVIVGESRIWLREHSVGVAAGSYLWSKVSVYGLLLAAQTILAAGASFLVLQPDLSGSRLIGMTFLLYLTALAGLAAGFLVSAYARTEAQAIALLFPYVVTQLLLSGVLVPAKDMGVASVVTYLMSARWAVAGLGSASDLYASPQVDPLFVERYGDSFWDLNLGLACLGVAVITLLLMVWALLLLRRVDRRKQIG